MKITHIIFLTLCITGCANKAADNNNETKENNLISEEDKTNEILFENVSSNDSLYLDESSFVKLSFKDTTQFHKVVITKIDLASDFLDFGIQTKSSQGLLESKLMFKIDIDGITYDNLNEVCHSAILFTDNQAKDFSYYESQDGDNWIRNEDGEFWTYRYTTYDNWVTYDSIKDLRDPGIFYLQNYQWVNVDRLIDTLNLSNFDFVVTDNSLKQSSETIAYFFFHETRSAINYSQIENGEFSIELPSSGNVTVVLSNYGKELSDVTYIMEMVNLNSVNGKIILDNSEIKSRSDFKKTLNETINNYWM